MDPNLENMQSDDYSTINLTLEDGTELHCLVVTIFEVEEQNYICLQPLQENGEEVEEPGLLMYRFALAEDGSPLLDEIEDDKEFQLVSKIAMEVLDADEDSDEEIEIEIEE